MIAKIILIGLMTLGLGMSFATHGKKRKPTNGWDALINYIIMLSLLYWGGFFNNI